jgi:uncharacterized protein
VRWHDATICKAFGGLLAIATACGGAEPVSEERVERAPEAPEAWNAWRAHRRESLGGPDGWTSVVALEWLEDGETTLGSQPGSGIVIEHAPASLGSVWVADGRARFLARAPALHDGIEIGEIDLEPDTAPSGPTVITSGSIALHLIARNGRLGLRVKDRDAPARGRFVDPPVWPYDARYRVEARFTAASPPRTIAIQNVLGMVEDTVVAGILEFELGERRSLIAVWNDDRDPSKGLFVLLRDRTSDRDESYPAGRFLDVPTPPPSGAVTADFNFLETPPCAYTAFATCPLPPRENDLDLDLRAGELNPRFLH